MSDLIDRQATIDAMRRLEPSFSGSILEQALKALPSAQPEIIRCKDCYWWDTDWPEGDICDKFDILSGEENFCCWAIRREDGNG